MNPLRYLTLPALAGLTCGAVLLAQGGPEPTFTTTDLASLDCRVAELRPGEPCQLLVVEVQNRGAVAAEPLEFRIEVADKKANAPRTETFARVQLPRVQRFGRPAPAGGKQSYLVATALPGKKPQFTVRVASASFYTAGEVGKPELKIGAPAQEEPESALTGSAARSSDASSTRLDARQRFAQDCHGQQTQHPCGIQGFDKALDCRPL